MQNPSDLICPHDLSTLKVRNGWQSTSWCLDWTKKWNWARHFTKKRAR